MLGHFLILKTYYFVIYYGVKKFNNFGKLINFGKLKF